MKSDWPPSRPTGLRVRVAGCTTGSTFTAALASADDRRLAARAAAWALALLRRWRLLNVRTMNATSRMPPAIVHDRASEPNESSSSAPTTSVPLRSADDEVVVVVVVVAVVTVVVVVVMVVVVVVVVAVVVVVVVVVTGVTA